MLLLGSLGVVFLLSIAGITPPALMSADAFSQVGEAYSQSLHLIDMAQSTGNITALAGLMPLMADLSEQRRELTSILAETSIQLRQDL